MNKNGEILKKVAQQVQGYFATHGVTSLQNAGYTGTGIKIAVIDGGLKYVNSDLQNITTVDLTGSSGSSDVHGMVVCSIIGATNDTFGVKGIAYNADITLLDIDDSNGDIYNSSLLTALQWIYTNGPFDIVSISLVSSVLNNDIANVMNSIASQNTLIFSAAGNSGDYRYYYPSVLSSNISVGSRNVSGNISSFTTRNEYVDIMSPGEDFISTIDTIGTESSFDGTSMATPFAAGIAALLLQKARTENSNPNFYYTQSEMISLLKQETYLKSFDPDWWKSAATIVQQNDFFSSKNTLIFALIILVALAVAFIVYKKQNKKTIVDPVSVQDIRFAGSYA